MKILFSIADYILENVLNYRADVVTQNLSRAFPKDSYAIVKKHKSQYYQFLTRILYETVFDNNAKLYISKETKEQLNLIAKKNQHIILILGHYGNWEALNELPLHCTMEVQAFYKSIKPKIIDNYIRRKRTKNGLKLLKEEHGLISLLKTKDQKKRITLFIADQFPGKNKGVTCNFLHQETHFFSGAERASLLLNAIVQYVELRPKGAQWEMILSPICDLAAEMPKDYITHQFAKKLEKSILENPSLWLWSHRRWK